MKVRVLVCAVCEKFGCTADRLGIPSTSAFISCQNCDGSIPANAATVGGYLFCPNCVDVHRRRMAVGG